MRIRIVRAPTAQSIGAARLGAFRVGQVYDVSRAVGEHLIAGKWAEPVGGLADDLVKESNPRIDRLRSKVRREGEPPLFDGAGPIPDERRTRRRPPKPHQS